MSKKMRFSFSSYIGEDTGVTVVGDYYPPYPQTLTTPFEPATLELCSVEVFKDDVIDDLSDETIERLEQAAWDYLADTAEDGEEE